MNYQQYIARRLTENQLKAIRSYPQPFMFGGVHPMDHPLASGNEYSNPSTLVTGSGVSGGKMSKTSKALLKGLKSVGNSVMPVMKDIGSQVAKNVAIPALTKYGSQALESYLMPAAEEALMDAGPAMAGMGMKRKRGRPRKGGNLLGVKPIGKVPKIPKVQIGGGNPLGVKPIGKVPKIPKIQIGGGNPLGVKPIGKVPKIPKVQIGGSFKSVMKKVEKVGKQVFNKALPMAEKYAANALMNYALPAAETGAEFVAANPEVLLLAAGRKKKSGGNRRQARADAVKSLMKDSSMTMIQASKFIKDNNIEY